MGSVQKYFLGFFLKYCMYFSFRPSCDHVYGSLALRSKGNIIDVFVVFKYISCTINALREFLSGNVWLSKKRLLCFYGDRKVG